MKLYSKKSKYLTELLQNKEQELDNINNELVNEVNDYITDSNKFYIGNAYCWRIMMIIYNRCKR